MKIFIIFVTIVAYTCAAPTGELQHPSPVNPNVLVEIKPEEKIIFITDPKEISKFKRDTDHPLYPTVLPKAYEHHRSKRDHNQENESKSKSKSKSRGLSKANNKQQPLQKPQTPKAPSPNKRNRRDVEPSQNIQTIPAINSEHVGVEYQKPQILPDILPQPHEINTPIATLNDGNNDKASPQDKEPAEQHKRDTSVPSVPNHNHSEETVKDNKGNESHECEASANEHHGKRDVSNSNYQHSEGSSYDTNTKERHEDKKEELHHITQTLPEQNHEHVTEEGFQKPQTLPAISKDHQLNTQQYKRDIPVPLVPKHHHPEESPKDDAEKKTHEGKNEENLNNNHNVPHTHHNEHTTPGGLQTPQTLPAFIQKTSEDVQQHKRDISAPKHEHSAETQKSNNENESHNDDKEINSELHQTSPAQHSQQLPPQHQHDHLIAEGFHSSQISPAPNTEHILPLGFQKPQALPVHNHVTQEDHQNPHSVSTTSTETTDDTQQHKRDTSVPNQEHSIESQKHNNEHENHDENKVASSESHQVHPSHQIHQTLPHHKYEHLMAEGFHRPHISQAHSAEHDLTSIAKPPEASAHNEGGFQTPQTHPSVQTEITKDEQKETHDFSVPLINKHYIHGQDSQKDISVNNDHGIQTHHLSHTLPAHNYGHVNEGEFLKPHIPPHHDNEHTTPTNYQNPQILPVHDQNHFSSVGLQKPQTAQKKRDIPVPLVPKHHHPEESPKESHEDKKDEEKKNTETHPNKDEVQVEDLSEPKPFQQSTHHVSSITGDHKSNILDHHINVHESTTSTTDHPIIRHRPVPVSELFARAHDN